VGLLRELRRRPRELRELDIAAADPVNLTGIVLPGERIPARVGRVALQTAMPGVAVSDDPSSQVA
jgi:ATP-dependent Lhr-like helicase